MFGIRLTSTYGKKDVSPFYSYIVSITLGPVVQNLTKLLANVALKFPSRNMAYTSIFFAARKM